MSVIFIALPIAILLGGAGMAACVLCIRNGQYDDLETPSVRMLIDDRTPHDNKDSPPQLDPPGIDPPGIDPPGIDPPGIDPSGADPSDKGGSPR